MQEEDGFSLDEILRRISASYKSIRLPGGVIGKTTRGMLAIIGVWGLIVWKITDSIVTNSVLVLVGVAITAVFIWWVRKTHDFAEKNPAQAMLDGAEFIEYQKFTTQIKGSPPFIGGALVEEKRLSRDNSPNMGGE